MSDTKHRFAGMDPYIERQCWEEFHQHMTAAIQAQLLPQLLPRGYDASLEQRVYWESSNPTLTLPMPEERREPYIVIHKLPERQLVIVIELLSPTNKNPETDGYRQYYDKRMRLLESPVHRVEIDLLRGGKRLPTIEPLPIADYYIYISRSEYRPAVTVIAWKLNRRLPRIPIPLLKQDPDAVLDLQAAYEDAYTRARYDLRLNYEQPL